MKKYYFLIILALVLGLVLTGCLLSNVGQVPTTEQSGISYLTKGAGTEADPEVIDLIAGQNITVGTVSVWNDCDELHVTYEITKEGWCLTETHLAVAQVGVYDSPSSDDIPQTKKGNPIPGQFPYQCCYDEVDEQWVFQKKDDDAPDASCYEADLKLTDPCLPKITYTISLEDWYTGTELFIAAHAVTEEVTCFDGMGPGVTVEGTEGLDIAGSITVEALVKVEASNDDEFYTIVGKWNDISVNERAWLLGMYNMRPCFYISPDGTNCARAIVGLENELNIGQWYPLKGTFDSSTGEIEIYVDNVLKNTNYPDLENIYLNGEPVLIGGDCAGGSNNIFFNGCIDEVKVWDGIGEGATLVLEWPEIETVWGAGTRFVDRGNWATYFTYDTGLTISSEGLDGTYGINTDIEFTITTTNPPLPCGVGYDFVRFNYIIYDIDLSDIASFVAYWGGAWYPQPMKEVDGNIEGYFGPELGFPMTVPYDETTELKINIKTADTYKFVIELIDLNTTEVLAFFTQDVVFE
jgi:hypothetical protein